VTADEPVWEAATEAIDAEFEGDLDRSEAALLEGLSRVRKKKAEREQAG